MDNPTRTHAADSPTRSAVAARYTLHEEIARGGMGEVYRATDATLGREVAVKVLQAKFGSDSGPARRFAGEARITGQLQHPAIPPVHDLGTLPDGRPFLAMKLIQGETLGELLKARPNPSADRGRFIAAFEAICQAVAFAHSKGVIHRDLKPANVMVGAFGEVQVMDWGLAKVLGERPRVSGPRNAEVSTDTADPERTTDHHEGDDSTADRTQSGQALGTPAYMPPEQARGELDRIDRRSDVFALGGVLCAILTGKPPFTGATGAEVVRKASAADLADARARLAACAADAELVAVCERCLSADPSARPADAGEVAGLVAAYRAGVEERLRTAERERAAAEARAAEQVKRRRAMQWAGGIIAAVLLAGTGVSLWQANVARQAAKNEAAQKTIADEKADAATKAEAATAAQLVKTQRAEADARAKTKDVEAALVIARERTKSLSDVLGDFVFGIQNTLANQPGTQELRRSLLETARTGLKKVLDDARKQGTPDSTLVWSYFRMGEVEMNLGNTLAAEKEYRAGHELAKSLADADPKNAQAQHDLSVSFNRLGDVTLRLGQTTDALDFYQKGLDVSQRLADADPKNAGLQRDLGVSFNKLGDVTQKLGQTTDALDFYRKELDVSQRLADADPKSAELQRDLGVSFNNLGNVTLQLGQTKDALDFYRKGLDVNQRLAAADPKNAGLQRGLGISFNRLGDVTLRLGQTTDALDFYKKGQDVRQRLADADPKNAGLQRDLGVSYGNLGDVTLQLGQTKDALDFYRKCNVICQRLAAADPKNAEAQRDLGVSFNRLGDVTQKLGQTTDALDFYRKDNVICQRSADADPKNAGLQRDLGISYERLGDVTLKLGHTTDALDFYRKGLDVSQRLADADPKNAQAQRSLLISFYNFGQVAEKTKDYADAIKWYEKALAVAEKFERPEFFANEVKNLKQAIAECKAKLAEQKPREAAPPPRAAR